MSDPIKPNFKPGVGRLATDRFTFQEHVDGASFKHNASHIDLVSTLVVGSTSTTNVQDALTTLVAQVNGLPPQPDATTTTKGFIKIAGDITGTADSIKVVAIQNKSISSLAPTTNQVLTWNGTSWAPATPSTFVAGTDLAGTITSQQVIAIGAGVSSVAVKASTLSFATGLGSPNITQAIKTTASGSDLSFIAQSTSFTNGSGGFVNLIGGTKNGSGLKGGVRIAMNGGINTDNIMEVIEPIAGQRVLGLFGGVNDISSTNMPAGTGDLVAFIKNTPTPPTSGIPSGGCIAYSSGGRFKVKQSDGYSYTLGDNLVSNPSTVGAAGHQSFFFTTTATSPIATNVDVINATSGQLTFLDNTTYYVEVSFVGKISGGQTSGGKLYGMVVINSGTAATVGSPAVTHSFQSGSGWTDPSLVAVNSPFGLKISSGNRPDAVVYWTYYITITISTAS